MSKSLAAVLIAMAVFSAGAHAQVPSPLTRADPMPLELHASERKSTGPMTWMEGVLFVFRRAGSTWKFVRVLVRGIT